MPVGTCVIVTRERDRRLGAVLLETMETHITTEHTDESNYLSLGPRKHKQAKGDEKKGGE